MLAGFIISTERRFGVQAVRVRMILRIGDIGHKDDIGYVGIKQHAKNADTAVPISFAHAVACR